MPAPPLVALLHHAIDYAGLFPPAELDLSSAVRNYTSYIRSVDGWALGRFVAPAARLDELSAAIAVHRAEEGGGSRWRVSAVLGPDWATDLRRVGDFNAGAGSEGEVGVDSLEAKLGDATAAAALLRQAETEPLTCYLEVPLDHELEACLGAVRAGGGCAKIRTGGVTEDAFPAPELVVRFLTAVVGLDLSFKATAGLHHPLRGSYRLTYQPTSQVATMYGFLNLFLAAGLLRVGAPPEVARRMLLETDRQAVRFDSAGVEWDGWRLEQSVLAGLRGRLHSFGSCSFQEPLDELFPAAAP